jgi:hypothetical protein
MEGGSNSGELKYGMEVLVDGEDRRTERKTRKREIVPQ